jgi:hypothetical protein
MRGVAVGSANRPNRLPAPLYCHSTEGALWAGVVARASDASLNDKR